MLAFLGGNMTELRKLIMERDGISYDEFTDLVRDARGDFNDGWDPESILSDTFGIEPDYLSDLLAEIELLYDQAPWVWM